MKYCKAFEENEVKNLQDLDLIENVKDLESEFGVGKKILRNKLWKLIQEKKVTVSYLCGDSVNFNINMHTTPASTWLCMLKNAICGDNYLIVSHFIQVTSGVTKAKQERK